jgi:hypothetical protein
MSFSRLVKNEQGFSMAEVVIAMVVFVASVLGVSMMLLSGQAAVYRGATESQAAELAQRKIEEVKTLRYYSPWTGNNIDIDDNYWAFDGDNPKGNDVQLYPSNAHVEDYGDISGRSNFKRTTAIQYQTMNAGSMTPAAMNTNWVPKSKTANKVSTPNFDLPKDTSGNKVRALIIEVKVYYHVANSATEQVYVTHALVSDLMVTGGSNNPVLVIKSISPIEGEYRNQNVPMEITVQSDGLVDGTTANMGVTLWYEGQTDIPCREEEAGGSAVVSNNGTLITCSFNLRDHGAVVVRPGVYSLAVYWKTAGWKDTSFRNCFTVKAPAATITGLSNYNWGHRGQATRQITITGTNFWTPTIELMNGASFISGSIVSSTETTIVARFNLSTITDANKRCDFKITTAGGTIQSETDATRLWVNPPPVITSITPTSSPTYYDWAHSAQTARKIRIEGDYLYGFEDSVSYNEKWMYLGSWTTTGKASWVSGPTGDEPSPLTQNVVLSFNPSTAGVGFNCQNSHWTIHLKNYGGVIESSTQAQQVLFNPTPQITQVSPTVVGSYYDWGHSGESTRNVRVEGTYLYCFNSATYGSAEAKMVLPSPSYTTANAGITTEPALNTESGTDPITFNFNPNGSGAGFNAPNTKWNVHLKNFGGTVDSTTDLMRVVMNPPPTISAVTVGGNGMDGNDGTYAYYNWAYKAQPSRYVRIDGTNLYALGQPGGTEKYLTNGAYTTGLATQVKDAGDAYALNATAYTIQNFNPSTIAGSPSNNIRYNVHLKNYGGPVDSNIAYNDPAKTVLMNPPPQITSWSNSSLVTATTGSATASGGGSKTLSSPYPYTGISLTGKYFQDGTHSYVVESNSAPATGTVTTPAANTASAQLSGSSSSETWANPSADGTTLSSLNILMYVNPNPNYFYQWGTTTNVTNAVLNTNGTNNYGYYTYIVNPDTQHYMNGSLSTKITHQSYTYTVTSQQPNWLDVSGGGARYQDENVTLVASAVAGYAGTGVTFGTPSSTYGWQEWNGSSWVNAGTSMSWNLGDASATKTYRARAWKKLYWGPDGANANYAGFKAGTVKGSGSVTMNYAGGYGTCMRAYAGKTGNDERTYVTGSTVEMTDATYLKIYWEHVTDDDPQGSSFNVSTVDGGEGDTTGGTRIWKGNDFSITTDSIDVSTYNGASWYVRFHARAWNDFWSGNGASDTRAYKIWLE